MSEKGDICAGIIQLMRSQVGQLTFVIAETPTEVFQCLLSLMADGTIEHVPNDNSLSRTYKLRTP